jgi:2-polyprenyl-3-methyl-5-hydroxy-6-metoxy-1,4-benzoquinol methylase
MRNPINAQELSAFARAHLEGVRHVYNDKRSARLWVTGRYRQWLAHYYNLLIPAGASVLEVGCGAGDLLASLPTKNITGIDIAEKQIEAARKRLPHGRFYVQAGEEINLPERFEYIILADTLNIAADVQRLLERLHQVATSDTRLLINCLSPIWRPPYFLARILGKEKPQKNWLAPSDIHDLLKLTDWKTITTDVRILLPFPLLGLEALANRWLSPLLPWLCLSFFSVARPTRRSLPKAMRVSVIVPARNEAKTIEEVVRRIPEMGTGTEIIFVEGDSQDGTWTEIQRVQQVYDQRNIKIMRQPGRGKGDAVRAGFEMATGEVLIILDADLTVPPEELPKFYAAIASGHCDFANGVRFLYQTGREMRFLNLCANKFFCLAFSWLLGQRVKDTLCGTKALSRGHYNEIALHRGYFGLFDPFGDFDLLLGAGRLNLRIADVPIRYQERTYGKTNIRRWRDGALLLRMLCFAARKLKFI